jgi:RNA polymerase sigma-70 factor (ECF subfamily)
MSSSVSNDLVPAIDPDSDGPRARLLADLDRRFRLPLISYFGRRVGSPAEAEDLTQDVFVRVLKSLRTQAPNNAEALVFSIAVNLLRDRARRERRHGSEEPLEDEIDGLAEALTVDLSPERVVLGESALAEVLGVLKSLNPRTRAMFCLYRLENLKIREIADLYGISASAVEKQIAKAIVHLTRGLHRK